MKAHIGMDHKNKIIKAQCTRVPGRVAVANANQGKKNQAIKKAQQGNIKGQKWSRACISYHQVYLWLQESTI